MVLHHTAAKIYSFQPFVICTKLIHMLYFYEGLPSDLQPPNFFRTILGLHGPPKMFDHDWPTSEFEYLHSWWFSLDVNVMTLLSFSGKLLFAGNRNDPEGPSGTLYVTSFIQVILNQGVSVSFTNNTGRYVYCHTYIPTTQESIPSLSFPPPLHSPSLLPSILLPSFLPSLQGGCGYCCQVFPDIQWVCLNTLQ